MEIVKADIVGYYFYCPKIENYDKFLTKKKLLTECSICKRFILDCSYDTITDNSNIIKESEIIIGKCGHMFHNECITSWLKIDNTCPIDKVAWQTLHIADTNTKLVLQEEKKKKYYDTNNKKEENTEENIEEYIQKKIEQNIK